MTVYAIPPLIGALVFAGLTAFVLQSKPRTKEKVLFSILCFETFCWQAIWLYSFYINDPSILRYVAKGAYLAVTPLPFTFYHFIAAHLKQEEKEKNIILFFYFLTFLMLVILFSTDLFIQGIRFFAWGKYPLPGPLFHVFTLAAIFSLMRGLTLLSKSLKNENLEPSKKNQSRYLLLGCFVYAFCSLDFLQVYGFDWYPIGTFFFIASFLIITYAIAKERLLDIQVVIKKTFFYSILAFLISALYIFFIFLFHSFFLGEKATHDYLFNSVALILLITLILRPLEIFLHRLLDKKFFKGTIEQISEQKSLLEIELERRERLKSVGILAAGMAHEIKNPITAIKTFTEYLPQKFNDAEFQKTFTKIVPKETNRILKIVKDLLEFSKPSEPHLKLCDLNPIVRDTIDLLSAEIISNKIIIHRDLKEEPCEAYIDSDQIKQALLNIIMNSIEAMKPLGGELSITTQRNGNLSEVSIADTGKGISKEKLPYLFDPFYSDKEGGTGLGLAITYSIIEKNKGKISVQSEEGKGTLFVLQLPNKELMKKFKSFL